MQLHKYHASFISILLKLYKERKNENLIDVTDCFKGTAQQNAIVFQNLNKSELARVKKEARVLLSGSHTKPQKFLATILPLGIEYVENFIREYNESQKERPQIGFKTKN